MINIEFCLNFNSSIQCNNHSLIMQNPIRKIKIKTLLLIFFSKAANNNVLYITTYNGFKRKIKKTTFILKLDLCFFWKIKTKKIL